MRYAEFLTEMAFKRKRIIRALESYDVRIFEHAMKIILMPETAYVPHWRQELIAWTSYLATLRLKTKKGNKKPRPMGFALAYEYLYKGAFVGNELGMTAHFIRIIELSYGTKIEVNVAEIHEKLKIFLTYLCHDIGDGMNPETTINKLLR